MDTCVNGTEVLPRHIPAAIIKVFELLDAQDELINRLHTRLRSVLNQSADECGGEPTVDSGTPLADEIHKAAVKLRQHNARLNGLLDSIEL